MWNRRIILIITLLVVLTVSAYILLVVIPARFARQTYEGAQTLARDIREAFQFSPEIRVDNTVILQEQHDILELALTSQRFRHEYVWTNTWMGSTKKITITGTFEAKAGFDLGKKFSIDLRDDKAYVTLPKATLLSVTPRHDMTFRDENGIWNWVDGSDRSRAVNAFTRDAEKISRNSQWISNAEQALEKRLTEILRQHGKEPVFVYDETIEKR
jgi:hypothetical protein